MTTSTAEEIGRASDTSKKIKALDTFDDMLARLLAAQIRVTSRVSWPSSKYAKDPVAFFVEILGVKPWAKQIEVIEAIRDNLRVAVKSGHKVSKSHTASGIALWFYCSFADARVIMTSTTARQVDDILWREVRMMRARCGLCYDCKEENKDRLPTEKITVPCEHSSWIDGQIGEMARTGLKSDDFREIKGFTAREAEAVAGISGKNLLYILDEASGIRQEIYEAIEGNRAGGSRVALFSNPTKTTDEFYDALNSKDRLYSTHTIRREDTLNVRYGDDEPRAIPGLAGRTWVNEKKEEWGEDSALYKVRVKGEFAELEEGKIFSIHTIAEAEARWKNTLAKGRLRIGLDPAGSGPAGDESVWCPRRGQRVGSFIAKRGQTAEAILMHTLGMIRAMRLPREIPVVVLDREGMVGSEVHGVFRAYLATRDDPEFELLVVRASDGAHKDPLVYERQRDCMANEILKFFREGGAIPSDAKLAKELHAFEWIENERKSRVKITSKKDIRKELGRSPDRYDALALAVWQPDNEGDGQSSRKTTYEDPAPPVHIDPYSEGIDPYA